MTFPNKSPLSLSYLVNYCISQLINIPKPILPLCNPVFRNFPKFLDRCNVW